MSLQSELSLIRKKQIKPVYTLLGKEKYLIETFKRCLKKEVLKEDADEFNVMSFDMAEVELGEVIYEAETLPFFGENKIIFIENPYFLTTENRKSDLLHDVKRLEAYLEQPLETSILVFVANVDKLDQRKKVVKRLKKESQLVDVGTMSEKQLVPYVKQYIENEGYTINQTAFNQLTYLTNMNLTQIMNELDKLFLFKLDDKLITKSDVTSLIPKSLEHNIFDLSQYVLNNESSQSLALYQELLVSGEETIKVISVLLAQIRLLLQVKILLDNNYQQSNITDILKIHPYRVKLAVQQCRKMKKTILGEMFNELVNLDYAIKTGQIDKELGFELFLLKTREPY